MPDYDLHRMVRLNRLEELRRAIAAGADINRRDELGQAPLHTAIAERNPFLARVLIDLGADLCAQDKDGATPPQYAISHKFLDLARELVARDPRVLHLQDKHGNEPLWTAAFNARGDYSLVAFYLDSGADPEHRNEVGLSPLDIADRKGDAELGRIFESRRAVSSPKSTSG